MKGFFRIDYVKYGTESQYVNGVHECENDIRMFSQRNGDINPKDVLEYLLFKKDLVQDNYETLKTEWHKGYYDAFVYYVSVFEELAK